jgi:hypothetical protein
MNIVPGLPARLVVGQRDLHRTVDRLGAGIDEEDAVEIARRELRHPRGELELLGMAARERRDEVELAQLRAHRVGDLLAPMARVDAEQAGRGIDQPLAPLVPVIHPLRAHDHLGVALEVAVGGERHPVFVERQRGGRAVAQGGGSVVHGVSPGNCGTRHRRPRSRVQ